MFFIAASHKLEFNASKTQLICFYAPSVRPISPSIYFNGTLLSNSDKVIHLGHVLTSTLDDTADIMRAESYCTRVQEFPLPSAPTIPRLISRSCSYHVLAIGFHLCVLCPYLPTSSDLFTESHTTHAAPPQCPHHVHTSHIHSHWAPGTSPRHQGW